MSQYNPHFLLLQSAITPLLAPHKVSTVPVLGRGAGLAGLARSVHEVFVQAAIGEPHHPLPAGSGHGAMAKVAGLELSVTGPRVCKFGVYDDLW